MTTDDAWKDPSVFGTVFLSDLLADICSISPPTTPMITGPDIICADLNNNYKYSVSSVDGSSYNWSLTNAIITSGENTDSITVQFQPGTSASINVTETNSQNCTSDSDIIDITYDCPTGNNSYEMKNEIYVYPNPFSDQLNIDGFDTYELSNLDGKIIQSGVINNGNIDTRNIESSVYFLKIIADHNSEIIKVIKK